MHGGVPGGLSCGGWCGLCSGSGRPCLSCPSVSPTAASLLCSKAALVRAIPCLPPRGCTPAALAPHACPPGAQALGTRPLTPFPKPTSGPSRPCPHWGARSQLPAPPRGPRPWLQPAPHSPFCGLLNCPGCHLAPGQSLCPLKALPMTPPCTRRLTVPHSGALSCCPLSPEITGSQRAQNRLPVTAAGQSEAQAARGVDGRLLEPTGAGAAAWGPRAMSGAGDAAESGRTWPYRRPGLAGALPGRWRSRTVSCPLAVLAQTTSGWVAGRSPGRCSPGGRGQRFQYLEAGDCPQRRHGPSEEEALPRG